MPKFWDIINVHLGHFGNLLFLGVVIFKAHHSKYMINCLCRYFRSKLMRANMVYHVLFNLFPFKTPHT